ncbi:MAG: transposase [Chlorogloea purpurea SAG 13.99]|nr:transposase [Chlorogloea purpurea SAG 13.99]
MTSIEKTGKFKGLGTLMRVHNGTRGLHLVVLYIALGNWRLPWAFRVYRGKPNLSHIQLGLRLLKTLPATLTTSYQVLVLVDTAFGSIQFLESVRRLKFHAVAGIRCDRRLANGGGVNQIKTRGQLVHLHGLSEPVTLSWYWVKRDNGTRQKRYVVSTKPYSWSYISRLGKQRWAIEAFFKTVKHRFSLHCFGQKTLLGVYRFLVLSMIAYILAHWAALWSNRSSKPDWGQAALLAAENYFHCQFSRL